MKKVFIYKRFERLWHWSQMILVVLMALTGFEVHSQRVHVFGFETAALLHRNLAWALIILIVFAIFWHLTTGEWRQYLPTGKFLKEMVRFYLSGIFRNAPHPVKKTLLSKLNPLQRLAYLGLKLLLIPCLVTTGLLYYFHQDWSGMGLGDWDIRPVALIHTLAAYLMVAFVVGHVYLTTTGRTPTSNLKAMITGWEEVDQ